MSIKDIVKIDLLIAVQRTMNCAHVEPIVDHRTRPEQWVLTDVDEPDDSTECPKCATLEMSVGSAVRKLERKANGNRPLVMTSQMADRKRRHRHAEPTDEDRIHNMSHDDDMRGHHRDGDEVQYCVRRDGHHWHPHRSPFGEHMAYTWEESDRMFHKMWHGEGER